MQHFLFLLLSPKGAAFQGILELSRGGGFSSLLSRSEWIAVFLSGNQIPLGYHPKLSAQLQSGFLLLSGVTRASRGGRWGLLPSHPPTAGINPKQALARSSCSCTTASIPPPEFIIKHQLSINISRKGWPGFTFMQGRCQALAGSQPFMFP